MKMELPSPKSRNVYLHTEVNQASALNVIKEIREIEDSDKEIAKLYAAMNFIYKPEPIKLSIDSYGGSVYQVLGLIGVIESCTTKVDTIVTGCALSCGFLLSICGNNRYASKHSTFLYHQVSTMAWGTIQQLQEDMKETKRVQSKTEQITLQHTKISRERLREVKKQKLDWWIDPKTALELGIIDYIL